MHPCVNPILYSFVGNRFRKRILAYGSNAFGTIFKRFVTHELSFCTVNTENVYSNNIQLQMNDLSEKGPAGPYFNE